MVHIGKQLSFDLETKPLGHYNDFAGHNIIFLDVDGVLNTLFTKDKIGKYTGIDNRKIPLLKELAESLNADIVLTSSWKEGWRKEDKDIQDDFANTLDERLAMYDLVIADRTYDSGENRGEGILNWISCHGPIPSYIILDDGKFDFRKTGIMKHLVQTSILGGLTDYQLRYVLKHMKKFKTE